MRVSVGDPRPFLQQIQQGLIVGIFIGRTGKDEIF